MSTHDYSIANGTGAAVRSDINGALLAIATNNSNSSSPSTTFASQFFANTSTGIMQLRNTANNAHLNLFTLAGGPAFAVDGTINSINIGKGANSVAGNTVLGESALDAAVSGGSNTAVGASTLTVLTSGAGNTAIGANALDANTTASDNTAIGLNALSDNSTGASNTAVGRFSLVANTTANNNTSVGANSLAANTTGGENTGCGRAALASNTSASSNTAVGDATLTSNTTGESNTAVGKSSLLLNDTGNSNCAFGSSALRACTSGISNTACGPSAGFGLTTGDNCLFLGNNAGTSNSPSGNVTTADNIVCVGNNNITAAHVKVAFTTGSDKRDKTDIEDFKFGLDWINKMRPVTYRWDNRDWYDNETPDGSKKSPQLELGLIAQEELEIEKEFGYADTKENMLISSVNSSGSYGMKYERIVPVLINAIKELSAKVTALEAG